jgi:inner membrane protein
MQSPGHIGAALLAALPLGTGLHYADAPRLALLGVLVAVAMSSVPDFDQGLPIQHRGPTHTVWFVVVCAVVVGLFGWTVATPAVGLVAGAATGLSLSSHLLSDSITPMGIRPYLPLSAREHGFDIVYAANTKANYFLFGAGVTATVLAHGLLVV